MAAGASRTDATGLRGPGAGRDAAAALGDGISAAELRLAARNHALPHEALRWPVTPPGLHYVLTHYDVPAVDAGSWRLEVGGAVARPLSLSLAELRALPSETRAVTLECAGNGRALLEPRPISQPWVDGAVGTAEWTGVPLAAVLDAAGVGAEVVEVLFRGLDRGIEGGVEQTFARSLPRAEALGADTLLAYAMNGAPLPPQHGFPLRLVVAGWYGMAHVKWLAAIEALTAPFDGFQQTVGYRLYASEEDVEAGVGAPVTRIMPRSLTIPPGIPEFLTRERVLDAGPCLLEGRAWSGWAEIARVEVSVDGGATWAEAKLGERLGDRAWRGWSWPWDAAPGVHEIRSRATDALGRAQPLEPAWNAKGFANNAAERIAVTVRARGAR